MRVPLSVLDKAVLLIAMRGRKLPLYLESKPKCRAKLKYPMVEMLQYSPHGSGERGMDWSLWLLMALVAGFFLWRKSKNDETAKAANVRLDKDARLYEHIKTGMREYNWREREQEFWNAKDGELLFETAHLRAFHVDHFAESRVGFYFKDIDEYGMWSFFAGNDDEVFETYYRSDPTFQTEQILLTRD